MNFGLTEQQKDIRKAVREFGKGAFDEDQILELIQNREYPRSLYGKACRLDFIGVCYPEEWGGQGCGLLDQILVVEELCRRDSSVGISVSLADAGIELVCRFGTDDQKKRCLPAAVKGKALTAFIPGDVDAGEACNSGITLTPAAGGGYRLNGEARFVTNAALASLLIVQAHKDDGTCDPVAPPMFVLLDRNAKGVAVEPMEEKLGLAMTAWNRVLFQDVAVFEADLLQTDENASFGTLDFQKQHFLRVAGMFLGMAQGAFDLGLTYSKQRVQFNRKIGEFQGIRHKISDMYIDLQAARALLYAAVNDFDRGKIELHDVLAAMLAAERAALHLTDEALQIFGGSGYMIELPIEHFYRDARTLQALIGRQIFHKDTVARSVIGKIQ